MPFIDARFAGKVSSDKKAILKSEFGMLIGTLNKPESYLMIQMQDNCELWFGGEQLEKGAYLAISLFGSASSDAYSRLTTQLSSLLEKELDIPKDRIYITYHPVAVWGWNGRNF